MSWTPERIEALKLMHRDGLSASQMARALGGITRNAAIGKCVRLGLGPIGGGKASAPDKARVQRAAERAAAAPKKPKPPKPPPISAIKNPVERMAATGIANAEARENPAENVLLMARAFRPLPGCKPVAFGSRGCKWPVSPEGADMMQCGAPRDDSRAEDCPYCVTHAQVAFKPLPAGSRNGAQLARSLRRWAA